MTIDKAFEEVLNSDEYKAAARQRDSEGAKYRIYMKRYKDGLLKVGAMVEILLQHGYTISANKVTKKKKQ